jgi:glycosyltransferase involved in cell wall biosynthesis
MLISTKDVLRSAYRGAVGAETLAALHLGARNGKVAISYAGARAGELGGTLVKVRLLKSRFPEHRIGFSLLYVLSNAIYVPQAVLDRVRAGGVPVVLNQNGVFYPGWYPDGWQSANARMAKVHAVADHVFYQSEFCRRCAERFLGARSGPSEILYNGVDTSHFTPRQDAPRQGHFTFLVTGKFGPSTAYRLTSSIAGLAAARAGGLDVRLQIAGVIDAKLQAAARAQVERLGITDAVTFDGPYTGSQAPHVYRSADAYLMTKHNDPCPNAVAEAMATALPVLYTASGGVPEQVGPEAGVGLSVADTFEQDVVPEPHAIAEGMARIIRGRDAMAAAARARAVERFGLSRWLARHEVVFRALVEKAA